MLPLSISYFIADFLYLILYKIGGYRTKVVSSNIKNAFPEKSEAEIKAIEASFYSHFCDLILEVIRAFSMSKKEYFDRVEDLNEGYLDKYYEEGRNVVLTAGHYGNWELIAAAAAGRFKHQTIGIYSPLKDEFLNKKITKSRGQLGLKLVSKKECKQFFAQAHEKPVALIFANDQSPSSGYRAHWTRFLNQDTAVVYGAEKFARTFNAPLVYAELHKKQRGKYSYRLETLIENPKDTKPGEASEAHTRRLEKDLIKRPNFWLWTHRRWKKTLPEAYGLYPIINEIKTPKS